MYDSKVKYVSFIVHLLSFTSLFGQRDPLADIFSNKQPIWAHAAIDSSAIGYKGRTGMDWYCCLAERKILIHEGALYLVYLNEIEDISGNFIEKLDLKTGKSLWSNAYDLRHSPKREYTNRYFINEENQLELLNFRYNYDTVWWLYPIWDNGKLSIRKYDLDTGKEIYKYHSPIEDSIFPAFKVHLYQHSYLHKDNNGDYFVYTMREKVSIPAFDMAKTRLDSIGKYKNLENVHTMVGAYKNVIPYTEIPILNNHSFDTIVRLLHTFKNNPYITGDSMEFKIFLLDEKLNELASFDVTNQMSNIREYYLNKVGDGIIGVIGREYTKNEYPLQHIFIFDFEGNLKEEIILPTRINKGYGICNGILKLKNEPGVLLSCDETEEKTKTGFAFYKSDGNGNIILHSEIITKDSFNTGGYMSMYEIEPNKILTGTRYRQAHLKVGEYEQTERFITALWDLDALTKTQQGNELKKSMILMPNPAVDWIKVKIEEEGLFKLNLYDLKGQLLLQKDLSIQNNIINIKELPEASYIVELRNELNVLIYAGKLIKIK
ncbi:MAG: T9SS type A sorting domain-containing protein [Saprospiraceae bacterium]|nr:T9SS type A sorting domain-containing protein [Saprospiraceae bacterium]